MKLIAISNDGKEKIIENVIMYDCFTQDDIMTALASDNQNKRINDISKAVIKKCENLDYYPNSNQFFDIVREIE